MSKRIRVGLIARIFLNTPVWTAIHLELFRDHGLDVSAEILGGIANAENALRSGQVDLTIGAVETVLSDTHRPQQLRIIGGLANKLGNTLVARRGIASIEQLRGATIGVSSVTEGTGLLVSEMLKRHGLHRDVDYTLESIGVASARWEKIVAGTLDAGLQTSPHRYIARELGYPTLGEIEDYVPDYQFTAITVVDEWARQHRDDLEIFLRCVSQAVTWMYEHPEECIALAARVMDADPRYVRLDYEAFAARHAVPEDLTLSDKGMSKVVELMAEVGTLDARTSEAQNARIDLSYLPRL